MSQAVELSDSLVAAARTAAEASARSVAEQIEFWADLGRAASDGPVRPLSELLAEVETPVGRARLAEYLGARPYPHFEPAPGCPGEFIRIEADGARTRGRFVGRAFQAAE